MKNLFGFFRGKGKDSSKVTNEDILKLIEVLNTNICDKNFDLLEENSKTKDKYFKLDSEYKESIKLIELRERDIKNLEKNAKQEKAIIEILNNLTNKVECVNTTMNELKDLLSEFKGNIYEVKPVKKCIGSKQKIQVKPSAKKSSIIKNVVGG